MLDKLFSLRKFNTDLRTEVLAGVTTFLATLYIVIVNPVILSHSGMPFSAVLTATVLISCLSSCLMGLLANLPIVVAPGMGINAFFAFTVVLGMKVPWPTALGIVFWSGVVFVVMSLSNVRTLIVEAIPEQLRCAISSGIGLFIALIGLTNAGFIVEDPTTIVAQGRIDAVTLTFFMSLLIAAVLVVKQVRGAFIWSIVMATLLCFPIGRLWGDASSVNNGVSTLVSWRGAFQEPDFQAFFKLDIWGALKLAYLPAIFTFLFTDLFDSLSTFVGVAEAGDLKDEAGKPRNIKKALLADALSTVFSGLFGTSSGTSYIESAAGIREGGRTGLTAVVAGLLFLPFLFLSPVLSAIPSLATAPVLVIVGAFMMTPITKVNWKSYDDAIPAFIAVILIPFSYSITHGIIWGFLSYTCIKICAGKRSEVSSALLVIDAMAILCLVFS